MSKKNLLPPVNLQDGEFMQRIAYQGCGCELIGKAPLPAQCPTHIGAPSPASETLVSIVLDESGSMDAVWDQTISAYNEYLDGLKRDGSKYLVSFTKFSSSVGVARVRMLYKNRLIADAPKLDRSTYHPTGGTPMYDAIGKTILDLDKEVAGRPVVMIILTDGENNSSVEFDADKIKSMIKEREGNGWTFVYLGANQDAWQVGQKFGVSAGSTYSYSTANIHNTMANMSHATARYTRSYLSANPTLRASMSSNFFAASGVTDIEADPSKVTTGTGSLFISTPSIPSVVGAKGGDMAAQNMTPKQRSARAKKGAEARWGGKKK